MLDKKTKDNNNKIEIQPDTKALPEIEHGTEIITGIIQQNRWRYVENTHYLDQEESATDLFYKPGDRDNGNNKFTIDGLDEETHKVAYDLRDMQRDLNKLGDFAESTKQSWTSLEKPSSIDLFHPRQGNEDAFISYSACQTGNEEFADIKNRIGSGLGHIDKYLIAAIIRLEVQYFKQGFDTGQDKYIQEHGNANGIGLTASIGPAQMQVRHIYRLVKQFPRELGQFTHDPLRAAIKPENAPHFVAGYLADVIQHITNKTKPDYIGDMDWSEVKKFWSNGKLNEALIYSYNPTHDHLDSVKKHLKIIHQKR